MKKSIEYGDIGTFEYADYDTYNLPAEENGLGGAKIYIDGYVDKMIVDDDSAVATLISDDKEWLLCWTEIDYFMSLKEDSLKGLKGGNYRVFGYYMGYSEAYNAPTINVIRSTDMETGISYSIEDFDGTFELWCNTIENSIKDR
ncbi:MAG: hypothetical protein IJ366_09215 [Clostridia bacterium]|nr:hypothetical protein [Clostridia bacterium]